LLKSRLGELRQQSRTVFFTSHALTDVAEICDRMAVMHVGRVRFAGTPAALCTRYSAPDIELAFMRCIGAPPPP
jgi:ABC-2 type transport system ATP-binding protein